MSKLNRDEIINLLLVHMNSEIESQGVPIKNVVFNFTTEESESFIADNGLSLEDIHKAINICISRGYISGHKYNWLSLTTEGQGRAISIEQAEFKKPVLGSTVHIGTLNNHGATQIGDGNTFNFEAVFNEIVNRLDSAEASVEEIKEAKSLLGKFIEHPVTNTVFGASLGILFKQLGM